LKKLKENRNKFFNLEEEMRLNQEFQVLKNQYTDSCKLNEDENEKKIELEIENKEVEREEKNTMDMDKEKEKEKEIKEENQNGSQLKNKNEQAVTEFLKQENNRVDKHQILKVLPIIGISFLLGYFARGKRRFV